MTNVDYSERKQQAEHLYRQYGKPLEADHGGKYLAVSEQGKTILANTLLEVVEKARATFGPGSFIFKVGPRSVGTWR
jgi:hypothetical protein